MTAKEYLLGLRSMKKRIEQLQEKKQMYLDRAISVTSLINPMKVQTSPAIDKMGDNATKVADLEREIEESIIDFVLKKHEMIDQIHRLRNANYIQILFDVYVQGKGLRKISKEMDLSYAYVRKLHGKALTDFEKVHADLL